MNRLTKYIISLTNLYGMVPIDKVVEIYNTQNSEHIWRRDIDDFLMIHLKELSDESVTIYRDHFAHKAIIDCGEFELMLERKSDKPYYIPPEEELFRYAEYLYFEKTRQYTALFKYVMRNFFDGDDLKAEMLCDEVHSSCQFDFRMQNVFRDFERHGVFFRNDEQRLVVVLLIMDLVNNIVAWENNGC